MTWTGGDEAAGRSWRMRITHEPIALTERDLAVLGLGERTPPVCNQVAGRRHWLLLVRLDGAGSTS